MSNYDFSTLSPLDFEKLTCDLMNAYFKKNDIGSFQTFKAGRDKGIDLLSSTPENDYEIIGQVKHYIKSPYSKLIYDLKNTEKDKVFKLNPGTYIVVTSLELSHQNKSEIKQIFEPYIPSIDNIFGRDDLNRILRNNRHIEESHYKLWFSSTIILNKLLNYKFQGRRKEFTNKVLKKKFRLFVITKDFYKAKLSLEKNRFIILTGEPGVGKSTLSDMLIYNYIKDDYQLNIIYDDIKDIEFNLIDDDSKQLFYFDDFLGHTQEEINKSKSAENALIRIISRIEDLKNKFLILNTRKFILNSFLEDSERFRKFNPLRSETKIELVSYSYSTKRRILENHILESNLDENQIKTIKNLAHRICSDKNFTPRIIEFFTDSEVLNLSTEDYESFILNNLKNPKEIWSHAYLYQITDYDRFLLNSLYSLNSEATIEKLKIAYEKRLNFEVKNNNFKKPINSFDESLRRLNDGFIIINDTFDDIFNKYHNTPYVGFINHSLEDYLKYSITSNNSEIERILFGSIYIDQWYFFFKPFMSNKLSLNNELIEFLAKHYSKFIIKSNPDNSLFKILIFLFYFLNNSNENLLKELFSKIKSWQFLHKDLNVHFYSKKFLMHAKSNIEFNSLLSNTSFSFFINSILNEENSEELLELCRVFIRHYDISFSNISTSNDNNLNMLYEHIIKVFKNNIEENYNYLRYSNTEENYHIDLIERIDNSYYFIQKYINKNFEFDYQFIKNLDWNQIAQNNLVDSLTQSHDIENDPNEFNYKSSYFLENYEYHEYDENVDLTLDDLIEINNSKKTNISNFNNDDDFDELPF